MNQFWDFKLKPWLLDNWIVLGFIIHIHCLSFGLINTKALSLRLRRKMESCRSAKATKIRDGPYLTSTDTSSDKSDFSEG